jgi:hypothetical protein
MFDGGRNLMNEDQVKSGELMAELMNSYPGKAITVIIRDESVDGVVCFESGKAGKLQHISIHGDMEYMTIENDITWIP